MTDTIATPVTTDSTATATVKVVKKRKSNFYKNYSDLKNAKGKLLSIGRNGELRVKRNYELLDKDVELFAKQRQAAEIMGDKDFVPNPFNRNTFNFFLFEALKSFGTNKNISLTRVMDKVKELGSAADTKKDGKTFWQRWKGKDGDNSYDVRFETNIGTLQRIDPDTSYHPFGLRLLEVGTKVLGTDGVVIDRTVNATGEKMIRLNTNSKRPVNLKKYVKVNKVEAVATEAVAV